MGLHSTRFSARIYDEFVRGSAIAPDLYVTATQLLCDTAMTAGGDSVYPIQEALNWTQVTRFGHQTRRSEEAIALMNHDGQAWQLKLDNPRQDPKTGKLRKYETPKGTGARAYFPAIPDRLWWEIAQQVDCAPSCPLPDSQPSSTTQSHTDRSDPDRSDPDRSDSYRSDTDRWDTYSWDTYSWDMPGYEFWDWIRDHANIPVVLTEGGKKALSLLSTGTVAIALYGVYGGHRRRDHTGERLATGSVLIPDLQAITQPGRPLLLAFDQDAKPHTRQHVQAAIAELGWLCAAAGCQVRVAHWEPHWGKGIDDVLAAQGSQAWQAISTAAHPLETWRCWTHLQGQLTQPAQHRLNLPDLSAFDWTSIFDPSKDLAPPPILAIASAKGTGKTKAIIHILQHLQHAQYSQHSQQSQTLRTQSHQTQFLTNQALPTQKQKAAQPNNSLPILVLGHRITLVRNLCQRLGISYRYAGHQTGLCVDSLLTINPQQFQGCILIMDEVVQVLRHLLTSNTCKNRRGAILQRLQTLVANARQILVADADLNDACLHYLQSLRLQSLAQENLDQESSDQENLPIHQYFNQYFNTTNLRTICSKTTTLICNTFQPIGYPYQWFTDRRDTAILSQLVTAFEQGQKIFIATDSRVHAKRLGQLLNYIRQNSPTFQNAFNHDNTSRLGSVLMINAETSGGQREQLFAEKPDQILETEQPQVVIATPSLATGISIEATYFNRVFGLFYGSSSTDADVLQALGRVRQPVLRTIWCAPRGHSYDSVSHATYARQVWQDLCDRTDATASLLKHHLNSNQWEQLQSPHWRRSPHMMLWTELVAQRNFAMQHLRTLVHLRLTSEGHRSATDQGLLDPSYPDSSPTNLPNNLPTNLSVNTASQETLKTTVSLTDLSIAMEGRSSQDISSQSSQDISSQQIQTWLKQSHRQSHEAECRAIAETTLPTHDQLIQWRSQKQLTPEQHHQLTKLQIATFYHLQDQEIDAAWVQQDRKGQRQLEICALEAQLYPDLARQHDYKTLLIQFRQLQTRISETKPKACSPTSYLTPWDIERASLAQLVRQRIGLEAFLNPDREWTKYDVIPVIHNVRRWRRVIKLALGLDPSPQLKDLDILHRLLKQLGLSCQFRWERRQGEKLRIYRLNRQKWDTSLSIIERRLARPQSTQTLSVTHSGSDHSGSSYPESASDSQSLTDNPPQPSETCRPKIRTIVQTKTQTADAEQQATPWSGKLSGKPFRRLLEKSAVNDLGSPTSDQDQQIIYPGGDPEISPWAQNPPKLKTQPLDCLIQSDCPPISPNNAQKKSGAFCATSNMHDQESDNLVCLKVTYNSCSYCSLLPILLQSFMRYSTEHRLTYHYSQPVDLAPHILRLCPRSNGIQTLHNFEVKVDPQPQGHANILDVEGNAAVQLWFNETPTSKLTVITKSTVTSHLNNPFNYLLEPWALKLPIEYPGQLLTSLNAYFTHGGTPDLLASDPSVLQLARQLYQENHGNTLDFLYMLNQTIYESCVYVVREEGDPFLPGTTWELKQGSCRDFSVLFMAVCRTVGLAARFVSGYEIGDPDIPEKYLHAWVEVFLPGAGWRGYDPTQGLLVSDRHIALAAAAQPQDASPLPGAFRGRGVTATLDHDLKITLLDD